MDISVEKLNERKDALIKDRDQLVATLNATVGAIQECDYWISVIQSDKSKT
jgi:hypothetical protein